MPLGTYLRPTHALTTATRAEAAAAELPRCATCLKDSQQQTSEHQCTNSHELQHHSRKNSQQTHKGNFTDPGLQILLPNYSILINLYKNIKTKSKRQAFRGLIATHH